MRLERLAPAVLLCMFDGMPEIVHIEEPRQGIQFGVSLAVGAQDTTGATLSLRNVLTAGLLREQTPAPSGQLEIAIPFRRNAPGVIDFKVLADRINAQPATRVADFEAPGVQSAEMAMQLLKFPYRQVFGDVGSGDGGVVLHLADFFRPVVGIETIRTWMGGAR
jgi:hypothetical protein